MYKGLLEKFSNEHTEVKARAAGRRAGSPNSSDRGLQEMCQRLKVLKIRKAL